MVVGGMVGRGSPAEESGRQRFRNRLIAAFEAEPFEDGMAHPAEGVIAAALDSEDPDAVLGWIRGVCLDSSRPALAAAVLLCVARQPEAGTGAWREELVRGGLAVEDVEVRDAAMQAAEHWGDAGFVRLLSGHAEQIGWLEEYRQGIVDDLGR